MSLKLSAAPLKNWNRLVATLSGLGQKGGFLRLITKGALLWSGIRGAISVVDRLIKFLRIETKPLLYRFLLSFQSYVESKAQFEGTNQTVGFPPDWSSSSLWVFSSGFQFWSLFSRHFSSKWQQDRQLASSPKRPLPLGCIVLSSYWSRSGERE